MLITNKHYKIELSDDNGALMSFCVNNREFIKPYNNPILVNISMIDPNGTIVKTNSNSAQDVVFSKTSNCLTIRFNGMFDGQIDVVATISYDDSPFTKWRLKIENRSNCRFEFVTYPVITVKNEFVNNGGDYRLFSSMMEGVVVEDSNIRDNIYVKNYETGFPAKGWEGAYPGACPMQFMAFYNSNDGLYFASHDDKFNYKAIEWALNKSENAVFLENSVFPGQYDNSFFELDYDIVLGTFNGDWYDAAEIYRAFIETTNIIKLPKLEENNNIPNWIKESPIVLIYPVRGEKDTGDMSPNCYYPYTNGLRYVEELGKKLNSKLMVLLCHWEGSAPWAPPFVWPPYGDLDNLREYITKLHDGGNLVGVYCSGIAWTEISNILPEYNMKKYYDENGLKDIMVKAPDQSMPYSLLCAGPIRTGYDMCPACAKTKDIAIKEIEKIIDGIDVDYIQFFDQYLGGNGYKCYANNHGHPASPGKWVVEENEKMLTQIDEMIKSKGKFGNVLIGCEAAASEATVNHLLFNDLRYNINYTYGIPVPAYNYIFHEYVNNFMGNQNTNHHTIDYEKFPNDIFYRFAYSFAQGDILTLVLKKDGKVHWDWCTPWDTVEVEQNGIISFVELLNSYRKNALKNVLQFGKLSKPYAIEANTYVEKIKYGGQHNFNSIITTRYSYKTEDVQILVNYLDKPQVVTLKIGQDKKKVTIISDALEKNNKTKELVGDVVFKIEARSVLAIKTSE